MTDSDPPKPPEPPSSGLIQHLTHAPVPTQHGEFEVHVYQATEPARFGLSNEHLALVRGDVSGRRGVPVRVHSECLTSEVFGSLKCDCKGQLDRAMAEIARRELGIIVYLRQEGRGIGLANKIRAYALQARGADTIEANEQLHLPVDARRYDIAAAMLVHLQVRSVQLMTNNPRKVEGLKRHGIEVDARIPTVVAANEFSASYLAVKKHRMQHELPSGAFHQEPSEADGDAEDDPAVAQ